MEPAAWRVAAARLPVDADSRRAADTCPGRPAGGHDMRLGSLRTKARDGQLALVSADLRRALPAGEIAPTVRDALDRWAEVENALRAADEQFQPDPPSRVALGGAHLLPPLPP